MFCGEWIVILLPVRHNHTLFIICGWLHEAPLPAGYLSISLFKRLQCFRPICQACHLEGKQYQHFKYMEFSIETVLWLNCQHSSITDSNSWLVRAPFRLLLLCWPCQVMLRVFPFAVRSINSAINLSRITKCSRLPFSTNLLAVCGIYNNKGGKKSTWKGIPLCWNLHQASVKTKQIL